MKRRDFFKLSGGATAAVCFPGLLSCAQARQTLSTIGLQLYTLRQAMSENVAKTLHQVAALGYRQVEFAKYFGHSPQDIARMLSDNGLTAPSTHILLDTVADQFDRILEDSHIMGHKVIAHPWVPVEKRGLDNFKRFADLLNILGEKAKAAGIQVCYHNHDFEFQAIDGIEPYEILLTQTDPDLVKFELDLYWLSYAGRDALTYFDRYPGRFPVLHVKDMDKARKMVSVGAGTIDFGRIFRQTEKAGIVYYFVEHDNAEMPFEFAKNSYDYLSGMTF